ncbi:MAG: MFS transporter [Patescibacteria group bacterium]
MFHLSIHVNKVIKLLLVILFIANVSFSLFGPLFAIFIGKFIMGATLATVGFAIAVEAVAKSVVQIPIARYLDLEKGEKDDFYAMLGGSILGTLYPIALPFVSTTMELYLLQIMSGVGGALLMAAYYSVFSHHLDQGRDAFEWSLLSVVGLTLSTAVGSAYGGIIADAYGFKILFLIGALLNMASVVVLMMLYPFIQKENTKSESVFLGDE